MEMVKYKSVQIIRALPVLSSQKYNKRTNKLFWYTTVMGRKRKNILAVILTSGRFDDIESAVIISSVSTTVQN